MTDLISRQAAIEALMEFDKKLRKINWYQYPYIEHECRGVDKAIVKIANLPSAQPERSFEIQAILDYLDTVLHPIISPEHWNVYSELHDMISTLPSAQPEPCEDVVSREYLTEHIEACWMNGRMSKPDLNEVLSWINDVPSAQPVEKDINVPVKDLIKGEPMSDLISTQEAVVKIVDTAIQKIMSGEQKLTKEYEQSVKDAVNVILNTARREAQADIVRCKDCKFYTEMRTDLKTGICSLACRHLGDDGFCSEAERRSDG